MSNKINVSAGWAPAGTEEESAQASLLASGDSWQSVARLSLKCMIPISIPPYRALSLCLCLPM